MPVAFHPIESAYALWLSTSAPLLGDRLDFDTGSRLGFENPRLYALHLDRSRYTRKGGVLRLALDGCPGYRPLPKLDQNTQGLSADCQNPRNAPYQSG